MAGLCNVAWAFVRFGLPVPPSLARGIAEASDGDGDACLMFFPMSFGDAELLEVENESSS